MTKNTNKVDLRTRCLELTKENLSTKNSSRLSKKQILHDLIFENPMFRNDIVFEMTMKVLEHKGVDVNAKDFNEETIELFNKEFKTSKNAVYSFLAKSDKKYTYKGDDKFKDFELTENKGKFEINNK